MLILLSTLQACVDNENRDNLNDPSNQESCNALQLNADSVFAVMDTLTVVVFGEIRDCQESTPASAVVKLRGLDSYTANTDSTGRFKFYHIKAGVYKLSANVAGYHIKNNKEIEFGTGEIRELVLKLYHKPTDTPDTRE